MSYENDDGTFDEDALYDRADDERAARKERDAGDYFDAQRAEVFAELRAGIGQGWEGRHVLIVEDGGLSYVAPHLPADHPYSECERVGVALGAFRGDPPFEEQHPPGRYWCSVDEFGNFEIGGQVMDNLTASATLGRVSPPELCGYRDPQTSEGCVLTPHVGTGGRHSWEA